MFLAPVLAQKLSYFALATAFHLREKMFYGRINGRNFAASSPTPAATPLVPGSCSRTHTADLQFPHFQPKSRSRVDAAL